MGRLIAVEAAKWLKPCVLELGGKSAAVVLDDADIEAAAMSISIGAMLHSGQICMSTERVIVQRGVSAKLIDAVASACKTMKAGDPANDPTAVLSALFTEASAENVIGMIEDAQEEGAHVELGDVRRVGSVVQPHILTGVKPGMKIWEQETFGPGTCDAIVCLASML